MANTVIKTGVLVVGSGPVGFTLFLLLSRMRIPCILLEKNPIPRNHPRAHYLSNRSMEIWRQLGNIDKALECVLEPLEYWRYFKYCRHIVDPHRNLYAVKDHFRDRYKYNGTYYEELSPSKIANFPQHKLLFFFKSLSLDRSQMFKRDKIAFSNWLENEYNFVMSKSKIDEPKSKKLLELERPLSLPKDSTSSPDVNFKINIPFIQSGLKFQRFKGTGNVLESVVKDVRRGREFNVQSMFVVGADGIHSSVSKEVFGKRTLETNVKYTQNLSEVMSVYFQSQELGEHVSSNPAMMYFIFSECICVLVCQGGDPPEFVAQIPFFPELESVGFFNEENCAKLINEAVGTKLKDLKIHKIKRWNVTTNVAENFIDKKTHRIFLAGDAAHLVAPAGGLGMNMGIADTYNLAWRIATTFYKRSIESKIVDFGNLLDLMFKEGLKEEDKKVLSDYESERKSIAEYTRDVCLKEVENGSKFAKHLWYNHGNMQHVLNFFSPVIPSDSPFVGYLFNSIKSLMKNIYDTPKSMDAITNFSKELFAKQDGYLGLAFPGSDLAYSYNGGELKTSKSHRQYSPQSITGMRIPHCYFYSYLDSTVYKISTVDLPSLMQPPVYHCVLIFDEQMIQPVNLELDLNLYYICLWETGVSVGSGTHNSIHDQLLSKPNNFINRIGTLGLPSNLFNHEETDDHFIFNTLEDSEDFRHFNATLKQVANTPNGLVKRVFSGRRSLDQFTRTLFGYSRDLANTYIVIRPDAHISTVSTINPPVK